MRVCVPVAGPFPPPIPGDIACRLIPSRRCYYEGEPFDTYPLLEFDSEAAALYGCRRVRMAMEQREPYRHGAWAIP